MHNHTERGNFLQSLSWGAFNWAIHLLTLREERHPNVWGPGWTPWPLSLLSKEQGSPSWANGTLWKNNPLRSCHPGHFCQVLQIAEPLHSLEIPCVVFRIWEEAFFLTFASVLATWAVRTWWRSHPSFWVQQGVYPLVLPHYIRVLQEQSSLGNKPPGRQRRARNHSVYPCMLLWQPGSLLASTPLFFFFSLSLSFGSYWFSRLTNTNPGCGKWTDKASETHTGFFLLQLGEEKMTAPLCLASTFFFLGSCNCFYII